MEGLYFSESSELQEFKFSLNIKIKEKKKSWLQVKGQEYASALSVLCLVVQSYLTLCDPMDIACLASLSMEFSRQEYGVGSHCLLQGILPTHGSNPGFLHCRQILYHLSHQGSPYIHIQGVGRLAKVLGTKRMIISRAISVLQLPTFLLSSIFMKQVPSSLNNW